jgi:hypothetical protein
MIRRSILAACAAVLLLAALPAGAAITVNINSITPADGKLGDKSGITEATIVWEISVDESESGTYRVEVDGDGTPESGRLVDDAEGAGDFNGGKNGSTKVRVADDLTDGDGDYTIYVIAIDGADTTITESDSVTLTLDNNPSAPGGLSVRIGDAKLFVEWDKGEDRDLKKFKLYYATHSGAVAADYDGTGADEGDSPIDAGTDHEVTVKGLENGVTYYFRVMAVDDAGAESPLSEEDSGTPARVNGLTDLEGESGNCFVATAAFGDYDAPEVRVLRRLRDEVLAENAAGRAFVAFYYRVSPPLASFIARHDGLRVAARAALFPAVAGSTAWLAVPKDARPWLLIAPLLAALATAMVLLGRRHRSLALVLLAPALLVSAPRAEAASSPIRFSAGLRAAFLVPGISTFEEVYDATFMMTYGLSFGYKLVKDFEIVGEASYGLKDGRGVTAAGNGTAEKYRLHLAPVSLSLLYRLKFYEDQPVVPYLGGGATYLYFHEERTEDPDVKTNGTKWGWQAFGGVQILLDWMDKRAASYMETDYGINNVYLVYEFRYQGLDNFAPDKEGLDLTSMLHTLGLLFEF